MELFFLILKHESKMNKKSKYGTQKLVKHFYVTFHYTKVILSNLTSNTSKKEQRQYNEEGLDNSSSTQVILQNFLYLKFVNVKKNLS